MVYAFPTNEKLWDEYAKIRAESLKSGGDGREATEFYRANREAMDAGVLVAWPARHNRDEVSAIQHAMNLKLRDEVAFWAEYQNEPLADLEEDADLLTADQIAAKVNSRRRGEVPLACHHLTMFVDVHDRLLYWMVAAWEEGFTGYILDYGAWPDQKRRYFSLRDARWTLARAAPGAGREAAILAGLSALTEDYLARSWRRDDGASMSIGRCLIDSGYVPETVYQCIRQGNRASVIMPSKGVGVGASHKAFSEYRRRPGDQAGHYWRIPTVRGTRELRTVLIDTNYWKSFVHARLATPIGDKGCLSLFGRKAEEHRLLAEHLAAEYRVKTEGRGRRVEEWRLRPSAVDNHWLDCLVGCAAAASVQGIVLFGADGGRTAARPRLRLSDLQRNKKR
jgi:phage terminase large subunit GpA-like protein